MMNHEGASQETSEALGVLAEADRVMVLGTPALEATTRDVLLSRGIAARVGAGIHDGITWAATARPVLCLVDGELPGDAWMEVPGRMAQVSPETRCILLAASPSGTALCQAVAAGFSTVLPWPLDAHGLARAVVQEANTAGPRPGGARPPAILPSAVVGSSAAMRDVWRLVLLAARSPASVLVQGETGTGKEVVARALHQFSPRRHGPFVAVNCAALTETLLESELFGHERGAFTGAAARHRGRFELADRGTLFLDEIGDLPQSLQVKLLRVLQERQFERVGGHETVHVDVRVVVATHRDLAEESRRERFRSDLFYRLNALAIQIPPLRKRKEDVLQLWESFLRDGAGPEGGAPQTTPEAQRLLLRHDWPGNVRELQNAAVRALAVNTTGEVRPRDLPDTVAATQPPRPEHSLVGLSMAEAERLLILQTYATLGTVDATSDMLGLSARTIHYRLKQYRAEGHVVGRRASRTQTPPSRQAVRPGARILLAEDDDDLRWALEALLQMDGHHVVSVSDGKALLEHLGAAMFLQERGELPEVIITDIRMPGMTGMQLLEGIRARGWNLPVVCISAFGDADTRQRALGLGATAFLGKPVVPQELRKVIRDSLVH